MLVTRLGVSVLKVVATIEMPTSHHGAARPEVKNSLVVVVAGESAVAGFDACQLCVFCRPVSELRGLERSTPAHQDLRKYVVRRHEWIECDSHYVAGRTHPDRRRPACVCTEHRGEHQGTELPRGGCKAHRELARALRSCRRHRRTATCVGRRGGSESIEWAVDSIGQVVAGRSTVRYRVLLPARSGGADDRRWRHAP